MVTVSIIEDDKNYREALITFINESQYFKILHAYSSAETALPHIIHNPPEIAMVDIKLPGKNGIDIISTIKQQKPEMLCLVCSFYDDSEYIFDALKNGASGYILKDSLPKDIIASLKELHLGGAPMSRYIARKVINAFQLKEKLKTLSELTDRQNEILKLIAKGMSAKEVGNFLSLSTQTVTKHLKNIYSILHVNNRIEAVNKFQNPDNA